MCVCVCVCARVQFACFLHLKFVFRSERPGFHTTAMEQKYHGNAFACVTNRLMYDMLNIDSAVQTLSSPGNAIFYLLSPLLLSHDRLGFPQLTRIYSKRETRLKITRGILIVSTTVSSISCSTCSFVISLLSLRLPSCA